ncbi:HEAT repeat domain-containing protein [Methanohalophilus sp.]|uniref:HEAT repeat domain-containing protein n=1 Tax=Methanohalophilus sp. TaxID=1966352 RepID=UPI00262974F7|nr:HEAT repeat domain-containing protein [Methanohalophilus sp.]
MVIILVTTITYADTNPVASENEATIEKLIEKLADGNISVRSDAVKGLVDIGEPAVGSLIQALENDNPDIRENSALALGKIGDKRAIEPLVYLIEDNDVNVRGAAEIALVDIGEESIDMLVAYAKNQDNVEYERRLAVIFLIEYGEKAVPSLIQVLSDNESFVLHRDVRYALSEIGEPAVGPLIELLESDDPDVKSRAIQTLGDIGDERAIVPLGMLLNDESEQVRTLAKSSIEAIENQSENGRLHLTNYGKKPDFYIEAEKRDFLDKLKIVVEASEIEMDEYIRSEGTVSSYGYNYGGSISVGLVVGSNVSESGLNEIYDIFDRHAQEIGIENVPVMFEYGIIEPHDLPVQEPATQDTPGLTGWLLFVVILLLYWKIRTNP